MSAWIVSQTHIDALVKSGIEREMVRPDEADDFGKMLWQENLNSIHYRYTDTETNGNYPGPIGFSQKDVENYKFTMMEGSSLDFPDVVHASARCYAYQSCEHPGYDNSKAAFFIKTLAQLTANEDNGIDGPWGTDERDIFVRRPASWS